MFVVLYRWKIKPELEKQFEESWSEVTKFYLENFDSLGSRLHRGSDGFWYGYAQWKSAEQRKQAFAERESLLSSPALISAREKMNQAIEKSFPETQFEVVADYLKPISKR